MKNLKYVYTHTMHYDPARLDGGFSANTSYIVSEHVHGFSEWLDANGITTVFDPGTWTFFVIDRKGTRTGEAYHQCRVELTDDAATVE